MTISTTYVCDECQEEYVMDNEEVNLPTPWKNLSYVDAFGEYKDFDFCDTECLEDYIMREL